MLILDASGSEVFVGILEGDKWRAHLSLREQALEALFTLTENCLSEASRSLSDIRAFACCEGPGSVLGIRLCAMAIRTWIALPDWRECPVFTYRSLAAAEAIMQRNSPRPAPYTLFAPSRMKRWVAYARESESNEPTLSEHEAATLNALPSPAYLLDQRSYTPFPLEHQTLHYALGEHPEIFSLANILTPAASPDAWLPEQPDYKRWDARPHTQPVS